LGVLYGGYPDHVRGATHYHTVYVSPKWRWIKEPVGLIGDHLFYK
jgi:spore germination cell wall hydrolase CwlJ-like protein